MARNVLGGNAQRAGDEIIVIGTINPRKDIRLNQETQILFTGDSGDGYIVMSGDNDLAIGNFNEGKKIILYLRTVADTETAIFFEADVTTSDPQMSSAGDLRIVAADTITINADDGLFVKSYERHIQIPAMLAGTPSNQPAEVDFFTAGGLQFATTGAKFAFFQWELPDDWDGTDLTIEVDWFPDSAAMAGTDTVQWTVEYACVAEGEVHGAGTSKTLTLTNSDDNARYLSIHTPGTMPFDDADQPLTKQDHIYFKVSRNTAVANDFGGSVTISAFEIIYKSNQLPRV